MIGGMKMSANVGSGRQLLVGGVATILLAGSGVAAVMTRLPGSTDTTEAALAFDKLPVRPLEGIGAPAQISPGRAGSGPRAKGARVKCGECGVVASTREIEQVGTAIDVGSAGVMTNGERHKILSASAKRYEVVVRMMDGSSRVFKDANLAHWRAGERLILIEATSRADD
jgi:hypothetical protein